MENNLTSDNSVSDGTCNSLWFFSLCFYLHWSIFVVQENETTGGSIKWITRNFFGLVKWIANVRFAKKPLQHSFELFSSGFFEFFFMQ
mgnify:FL=1